MRRLLVVMVLTGAALLAVPFAADAQTCPPPLQTCPTAGLATPGSPTPSGTIYPPAPADVTPSNPVPQFGSNIVPDETVSRFPLSHYEVYWRSGHFYDWQRNTYGFILSTSFDFMKLLIQLASWIVTWAFTFGFAALLADPAAKLGVAFAKEMIVPLGLGFIGLMATMVYAGLNLMRGHVGRAVRELAVTGVVLVFAGIMLANPARMLLQTNQTTSELSGEILSVAAPSGQIPASESAVSAAHPEYAAYLSPQKAALTKAFVDEPYDLLNWGAILTGKCAVVRDLILTQGPWGSGSSTPRDTMASVPECKKYADFNADPGSQLRYLWAPVFGFVALIVLLVVCIVAASVVAAQFVEAALVALEPFALVGGLFPGRWRKPLWKWARRGLEAVFAVLALSVFMTFLTVGVGVVLSTETAQPIAVQLASLLILVALMIHLLKGFRHVGVRAGGTLGKGIAGAAVGRKAAREIGRDARSKGLLAGGAAGGLTLGIAEQVRAVHGSTIEPARDFYESSAERLTSGVAGWRKAAQTPGDVKRAAQKGAAVASVIPGVGTGVGALVGGSAKVLQLGAQKAKCVASDVSLKAAVSGGSIARQKREALEARLAGVDTAKLKETALSAAAQMVSPMARSTELAKLSQADPVRGASAHMPTSQGVSRLATADDAARAREWAADERTRRRVVTPGPARTPAPVAGPDGIETARNLAREADHHVEPKSGGDGTGEQR